MDQDSNNSTDQSQKGAGLAMVLVALPILYVVLLGPAARIYDSCPEVIQKGIECVYMPLQWLDEQMPERPILKYIKLWRR